MYTKILCCFHENSGPLLQPEPTERSCTECGKRSWCRSFTRPTGIGWFWHRKVTFHSGFALLCNTLHDRISWFILVGCRPFSEPSWLSMGVLRVTCRTRTSQLSSKVMWPRLHRSENVNYHIVEDVLSPSRVVLLSWSCCPPLKAAATWQNLFCLKSAGWAARPDDTEGDFLQSFS